MSILFCQTPIFLPGEETLVPVITLTWEFPILRLPLDILVMSPTAEPWQTLSTVDFVEMLATFVSMTTAPPAVAGVVLDLPVEQRRNADLGLVETTTQQAAIVSLMVSVM